jgi:hypothetical protein
MGPALEPTALCTTSTETVSSAFGSAVGKSARRMLRASAALDGYASTEFDVGVVQPLCTGSRERQSRAVSIGVDEESRTRLQPRWWRAVNPLLLEGSHIRRNRLEAGTVVPAHEGSY